MLNCQINQNMVSNVLESKSIALEYISLLRLKQVYENFLKTKFTSTINSDMNLLMNPSSGQHYFAVLYWLENKKLIILQTQLINVLLKVLEWLMKGYTFEFAMNRVFEIEEKRQYYLNRIWLDEYLKDLLLGLSKLFKSIIRSDNEEALKAA